MTDPTVSSYDPSRAEPVEVITSVQRRRHWTMEEKVRLVEETFLPGQSVSLVARRHGMNANQLFTWRRLMARGAFSCRFGSRTTTTFTRTARSATARRASSSPDQPRRSCPVFKGQQQEGAAARLRSVTGKLRRL